MQNTNNEIIKYIKRNRHGKIFFADEFRKFGNNDAVRQALSRLCRKNFLIRLSAGIYLYPKFDNLVGIVYPSIETIAKTIAKREKTRLIPTGAYALNALGLSTQVPANFVFLTDGSPRRIKIGPRKGILFKHTAPKNLAFKSDLAMLITFALKEIKKDRVTSEHLDRLKYILKEVPKEEILQDIKLIPSWIKDLILNLYE